MSNYQLTMQYFVSSTMVVRYCMGVEALSRRGVERLTVFKQHVGIHILKELFSTV